MRDEAEELWERIGNCICCQENVPHWCERCQRALQALREEFARVRAEGVEDSDVAEVGAVRPEATLDFANAHWRNYYLRVKALYDELFAAIGGPCSTHQQAVKRAERLRAAALRQPETPPEGKCWCGKPGWDGIHECVPGQVTRLTDGRLRHAFGHPEPRQPESLWGHDLPALIAKAAAEGDRARRLKLAEALRREADVLEAEPPPRHYSDPLTSVWKTAALLKDRTRRAIRERVSAGESIDAVATDYGVPVAFVEQLVAWQLFGEDAETPRPQEK